MIRLSSYSILSDQLPGGGYALMNGCTGGVDLISNELGRILEEAITEGQAVYLPSSAESVDYFIERGHFTALTHEEERAHVTRLAELLHEAEKNKPVFLIIPNFDCNYRCTYCFERPLQNGLVQITSKVSHKHGNVVMQQPHIDAVYKSIREIQLAAGIARSGGQIILYGGEPLDGDNRIAIYEIVNLGVAAGFCFAAITNGHDLDQFLPLMGDGGIKQVQVSIDGPKHVHDKRRIYRKGGSSFDKIVVNVRSVLAKGGTMVQLRVHVDPSNINLFDEVLQFFEGEGWLSTKDVIVYANTVYSKDKTGNVSAKIDNADITSDLQRLASRHRNVFINAASVNARMTLLPALTAGDVYRLKSTYCAANTGQYIFAPDGHIYACWESVGKDCSRVGSYMTGEGLIFDKGAVDRWFNRSTAMISECLNCPYCLVCGGGCAQYAEYNTKTLYKPYCDDFQRVFRTALADNVEEYLRRAEMQEVGQVELAGLLEQHYG